MSARDRRAGSAAGSTSTWCRSDTLQGSIPFTRKRKKKRTRRKKQGQHTAGLIEPLRDVLGPSSRRAAITSDHARSTSRRGGTIMQSLRSEGGLHQNQKRCPTPQRRKRTKNGDAAKTPPVLRNTLFPLSLSSHPQPSAWKTSHATR